MKQNGIKTFFCLLLCASLVICSFCGGNEVGSAVSRFLGYSVDNDSAEQMNIDSQHDNEIYFITGYGGGGYVNASADVTPTDIETLKSQAKALFENYSKAGNIKETHMGATGKTLTYGVVDIDNKTAESINIRSLLNEKVNYGDLTKDKPCILIYHTHTTEGYEMLDLGWYAKEYNSRTEDTSKNMVRVGDELTRVLEEAGYSVIHDRNIYDKSYNGAYSRSRVSVEKYLKEYPSIKITLDVHRDAIQYTDGTKCKPTAEINGKKAAQIMIISGCEGDGVENFPSWKDNLAFATHLQSQAEEMYPELMRPIFFCNRKYNMDVTPCSLLLEFGTDANTLEEAVYSAQLIGDAIAKLLDENMN